MAAPLAGQELSVDPTEAFQNASPEEEALPAPKVALLNPQTSQPTAEAEHQPDEPLASGLVSNRDIPSPTESPAPPAEFDWLDDGEEVEPTATEIESSPPTRTAVAAWRMSSKWSLAVAYFAKGLDADRYRESLDQATYAAQLLDLDLPALPEQSEGVERQQMVIRYLLEESGPQLLEQLAERFPANHAALAELALKTHLLLLVYTPSSQKIDPLIASIRQAAANSGLPESVWQETVVLLEQRAEFARVKQAVFQLHRQAANFLSGSTANVQAEK